MSSSSNTFMANTTTLFLFLFVLSHGVATTTMAFLEGEEAWWNKDSSESLFLMQKSKRVVKTDFGEMRVLKSHSDMILDRHMHIGFINMEPKSLFIPQYLDSNLIIFISRGEAKLGFTHDGELAERRMKTGDVYVIPAGTTFYLVNTGEGQRLKVICSIDPSTNLGSDTFQSFYIGGGTSSPSVLSAFDSVILETAFNKSRTVVDKIFSKDLDGPFVYIGDSHAPSFWTKFLQLNKEEKVLHLKKMVQDQEEDDEEEEKETSSSWMKLFKTVFGMTNEKTDKKDTADSPDSYNMYDKKADFSNAYGWSKALHGGNYAPLKIPNIGIFHVYLTAGSMMSPHVNPTATEYAIVLNGYGRLQIVFPNGRDAVNIEIKRGDVFIVPKFFPFCQIASRDGALEFFGFSTSAEENKPIFLAGAASLLRTLMGPELAAGFGVKEDTLRPVVYAQPAAVIMPSAGAAPPEDEGEERRGREDAHADA